MRTPKRRASAPARPARRHSSRDRRSRRIRRKTAAGSMAFSRRLTLGALFAAALAASGSAPAQNTHQDKQKVFQFALQNGMQVLVVPDHRAPVITQMLWYRVGAVDDPP